MFFLISEWSDLVKAVGVPGDIEWGVVVLVEKISISSFVQQQRHQDSMAVLTGPM